MKFRMHRRGFAIQCRICNCTYALPKKNDPVSHCPSCGSKNQRGALEPI